MYSIFDLFWVVMSAVFNAVGVYFAVSLIKEKYPPYKDIFITILWGYIIFVVISVTLFEFQLSNRFYILLTWFVIMAGVIYRLVGKLGIVGKKNIIIFIGVSYIFNMLISMVFGSFFY